MNISQRLRTCAKHTGLDAVIELLQEAADEIDRLSGGQQAEAQQPATPEPAWCVATGERVNGEETYTHHDAYVPLADCFPIYTHPAPGVPDDVARDAKRYRWLLKQAWFQQAADRFDFTDGGMQARFEKCMDDFIDAAMTAAQAQKGQP